MKYALIGCGRIAVKHIRAALSNGFEVVALCDISEAAIDSLIDRADCESLASVERYTDYRCMLLDHPELELVAIATESGSHATIALDCIDVGKHLIIEKPLALSMVDANEIVARANAQKVKVAVCHQNRFNEAVQCLHDALDKGRFGALSHGSVNVRWNRSQAYYDQASWRGTWEHDGGTLMNQCIHGIDLLRWLMGSEVISVYGVTRRRFHDTIEAEDVGLAILQFADGAIGSVEGTSNVYPENLEETLTIFGRKGTAKLGGVSVNQIDVWKVAADDEEEVPSQASDETSAPFVASDGAPNVSDVYGGGHQSLYADMLQAIRLDRSPTVDAQAGRDAVEIVLAIYQSQKTGQLVQLPLEDFSTNAMVGVFL